MAHTIQPLLNDSVVQTTLSVHEVLEVVTQENFDAGRFDKI